jgi:hypothetical protein
MRIGPSRRHVLPLLGLAPALALAGCGKGYDVARHETDDAVDVPADKTCRFEQSRQPLPVSRASWLTSLDIVTPRYWPKGMYEDFRKHQEVKRALGSRAPDWPTPAADRYRFERFRTPARSFIVRPDDHTLYMVSLLTMRNALRLRNGGEGSGSFHTIVVLDVDGGNREHILVRNVEGGRSDVPLEMQVEPVGAEVLLVYASTDSIFQIVGRPTQRGFEFSEPQVVHETDAPALDLCLGASPDAIHLVWTQAGKTPGHRSLRYASTTGPGAAWSEPTEVSLTARPYAANLAIDGPEIFVAWIDGRFDGTAPPAPRPGRVMVVTSRDEGKAFSRPVVISDLHDPSGAAAQLILALGEPELVVYWSADPPPKWPDHWHRAALDRDLEVVTDEGRVNGKDLLAAYTARMTGVFEGTVAAERTAAAEPK